VKDLYHGRLDPRSVEGLLNEISHKKLGTSSDYDVVASSSAEAANGESNNQILKELHQYTQHLPIETANAYNMIFIRITDIKNADAKGWQHRPVYRVSFSQRFFCLFFNTYLIQIAWMYFYVYRNIDRAKSELMKLFTLRPTIKNHVNIWKPGFEL
jgi:hypothetical protein